MTSATRPCTRWTESRFREKREQLLTFEGLLPQGQGQISAVARFQPRPDFRRACVMCAMFARQRQGGRPRRREGGGRSRNQAKGGPLVTQVDLSHKQVIPRKEDDLGDEALDAARKAAFSTSSGKSQFPHELVNLLFILQIS